MDMITWPAAVGFIGSVSVICLTILRIFNSKKSDKGSDKWREKIDDFVEKQQEINKETAVQESEIKGLKEDGERLGDNQNKLHDLLLRLLTDGKE